MEINKFIEKIILDIRDGVAGFNRESYSYTAWPPNEIELDLAVTDLGSGLEVIESGWEIKNVSRIKLTIPLAYTPHIKGKTK